MASLRKWHQLYNPIRDIGNLLEYTYAEFLWITRENTQGTIALLFICTHSFVETILECMYSNKSLFGMPGDNAIRVTALN